VNQEDQQQPDLDHRDERIGFEGERVLVEETGTEEDEEVTGDVYDEIEKESQAGNTDDDLRPD